MGRHGVRAEMNDNGERWADFCQVSGLVIGGTWVSPDGGTTNQIEYMALSKWWRSSLQDVRVKRGADAGSDHHLMLAKIRLKIGKVKKGET